MAGWATLTCAVTSSCWGHCHPLLTLTRFQPPATPGSHSPCTLKAEAGVGPAGTDRPAPAPRQQGGRPLNSQRGHGEWHEAPGCPRGSPQASSPGLRPLVCFWAGGCLQGCSGPGLPAETPGNDGLMAPGRGPVSLEELPGWACPTTSVASGRRSVGRGHTVDRGVPFSAPPGWSPSMQARGWMRHTLPWALPHGPVHPRACCSRR